MVKVSHLYEKGTGMLNEDAISVAGSLYGVFDGATSLSRQCFEKGLSGGFLASHTAREVFSQGKGTLTGLADQANAAIREKMRRAAVDTSDKTALWSTAAAVVKIEGDRLHWVQIGDSLILFVYEDGSFHIPVRDYDHDTETLAMWKDMAHSTDQTIMEALSHQIRKVRTQMNVAYGVLNGEDGYASFLQSGTVDLKDVRHVLLFTDGLFIPSEQPGQSRFDTLVDLFHEGGLPAIRNHVRQLEASDPACIRYPRFKTHDDIAAVSLSLETF